MTLQTLAAQITDYQPVLNFGLAGALAFYLLHVVVKRLDRIDHRLVGVQRVLLINLIASESTSVAGKAAARQELEKTGGTGVRSNSRPPYE